MSPPHYARRRAPVMDFHLLHSDCHRGRCTRRQQLPVPRWRCTSVRFGPVVRLEDEPEQAVLTSIVKPISLALGQSFSIIRPCGTRPVLQHQAQCGIAKMATNTAVLPFPHRVRELKALPIVLDEQNKTTMGAGQ